MNKKRRKVRLIAKADLDEILPEYDFSHAERNQYAARYASSGEGPGLEVRLQGSVPLDEEAVFTLGFSDVNACHGLITEMGAVLATDTLR